MESPNQNIVLKSKESGNQFTVDIQIAKKYLQVVRNFEPEGDVLEDFELQLKDEDIKLIIEYINHHGLENVPAPIPKPLPSSDLFLYVSKWDYEFITKLNEIQQASLMEAANYLNCQELLELISAHTVSILIGHTLDELRQEYGIQEQLTSQLEAKIKQDHEKNMFQGTKFEQFQQRELGQQQQQMRQQQMQQQQQQQKLPNQQQPQQ